MTLGIKDYSIPEIELFVAYIQWLIYFPFAMKGLFYQDWQLLNVPGILGRSHI